MAKKFEIDRLSALPDNILTCNILSHLSLRDVIRTSVLSTRWRSLWKLIPDIDRLSALPDNILACNILSHLSLRDVVRTSLLSSRWRCLWKKIPHLDFTEEFFESLNLPFGIGDTYEKLPQNVKYINSIIENILVLHSGHIERLSIDTPVNICRRLHVGQWVHHAALKEVKHLSLLCSVKEIPPSLFACRFLRDLKLLNFRFRFRGIPTEFDGFRFLQSCSLLNLDDLTDDGLQRLIGLSPLLNKLVIKHCWQLINLKIQAPNLKSLKIESCFDMESLTADCPQLVELEIENCERLIEFKMNSCVLFNGLHTSDVRIPKEHLMLSSLRKLSVKACVKVSGLTLLTTLGCFHNLEEVHIWIFEDNHYSEQERAKCGVADDSTFRSLKEAHINISSVMKKDEAIMLAFLLKNAPLLNTITVTLPRCPKHIHDMEFKNKVMDLQKTYEKVDIRMEIDEERLDATCIHDDLFSESDDFFSESDVSL